MSYVPRKAMTEDTYFVPDSTTIKRRWDFECAASDNFMQGVKDFKKSRQPPAKKVKTFSDGLAIGFSIGCFVASLIFLFA